jgi:hypothetical protein
MVFREPLLTENREKKNPINGYCTIHFSILTLEYHEIDIIYHTDTPIIIC